MYKFPEILDFKFCNMFSFYNKYQDHINQIIILYETCILETYSSETCKKYILDLHFRLFCLLECNIVISKHEKEFLKELLTGSLNHIYNIIINYEL